jgi:tetratricopeptide (TPR) repeat protein
MMLMPFRKTTIAVEFCYRRKRARPQEDIFWIHGNSEQTFKASYLQLGRKAGLFTSRAVSGDDDEEGQLDGVKTWLERTSARDWVLVIDNLDDIDLKVNQYLPVGRGTILFTTRDKRLVGHEGYLSPNEGVEIAAMSDQEALETFGTLLGREARASVQNHSENEVSRQLLVHFGNLPLAIAQAAAYIRETGMTILAYLNLFNKCERNQHNLLSEGVLTIGGSTESDGPARASRAVMTTWKITVAKIEETSPDSVRLLEILSFLGPDEIPEELITAIPFLQNDLLLLHKTVKPLLSFALLYRLETSNYHIHRLVASAIRAQLGPEVKDKHLETAVELIFESFPDDRTEIPNFRQLIPHAVATLEHTAVGHRRPDFKSHYNLNHCVGSALDDMGDYRGALEWYQRALDGYEKTLGKDHPSTLSTVNNMAIVFRSQGEYDKALEWYQRALDGYEKTLGKDHPSTLDTIHNMAVLFKIQGEYDKALEWYQRALDGCEKTLGKDHPSTLDTIHNMAVLFENQGEYDKALEWYQRALDGYEKRLGTNHPSTLQTLRDMTTCPTSSKKQSVFTWLSFRRLLK